MILALLLGYLPFSWTACVHFKIDLTWETRAPDGVPRSTILSNGQLPGPPLYLDFGDDVEVRQRKYEPVSIIVDIFQFEVQNNLPFDTAVHFHGIELVEV